MEKHPTLDLIPVIREIEDPRMDRTRLHNLVDILVISICAVLCGAESFEDMAFFGECKEGWFGTFLELPNGIPSHDTFGRVFAALEPKKFLNAFMRWTQSLRETLSGEVVAIDGKALRRAIEKGESPKVVVSAWAAGNGLGQRRVADKSNEITAVPELLRSLELAGCIVTLDAIERKEPALDYWETVEKGHGRIETRRYWQSDRIGWFAEKEAWESLRSVGVVEAVREMDGKISVERRYSLSSLPLDAQPFGKAVRSHWGVENQLHWVLDVVFNEDQSRARNKNAGENLATLRRWSLNLTKADKLKAKPSL